MEISGSNKPYSVLEDEQELDIVAFNKVLINASDKFWDTRKKMDQGETKKKLNQAKSQRLKDRLQTLSVLETR